MILKLLAIFFNQSGGLGLTQASIVSAVADGTGDDSPDAAVKIKRLINEKGPDFCMITGWEFMREDITFTISSGGYAFSGASYLPQTFKKALDAYILDQTTRCPLEQDSLHESGLWPNPLDNDGLPEKFAITRIESDYWEIAFNREPDQDYDVYMEIEKQWVDLTAANETVITKPYYTAFVHFVKMARFLQQGDTENYAIADKAWFEPINPQKGILGRILKSKKKPLHKLGVVPGFRKTPFRTDYTRRSKYA